MVNSQKKTVHFPKLVVFTVKLTTSLFSHFISYITLYEGWNFNSGNYLFTTDTK